MDLSVHQSGAAAAPPSPPASPSVGYPTAGNPGTGLAASIPGAYWRYQIQAEMAAVLAAAGLTASTTTLTQLRDSILRLAWIPGQIITGCWTAAPEGTLKANGAAVSVATYARLAAAIYCGDSGNATADWGYRCNNSDGSSRATTGAYIVLPDRRGRFGRGLDDGSGVDTGRSLYAYQSDEIISHNHPTQNYWVTGGEFAVSNQSGYNAQNAQNTGNTGGTETRPKNAAELVCIVY